MSGTIVPVIPQTVSITKYDEDTNIPIPGAKFKLQQKNENGEWEDYNTSQVTDENGRIDFNNVGNGTFRFVEEEPDDYESYLYDINSVSYKSGDIEFNSADVTTSHASEEFEVTNTEGKVLTATNKRKPVSIKVNKIWDDNSNQFNLRPETVTIALKADGNIIETLRQQMKMARLNLIIFRQAHIE